MNMKPLAFLAVLAALPALTMVARAQSDTPDNLRIVAGSRLGRVFLGDSRATVRRRLGAPTKTFKLPAGLSSEMWRGKEEDEEGNVNTLEVVYRRGVAVQIEATSAKFKTPKGLSSESYVFDWVNAFGQARRTTYNYSGRKARQSYYDWTRRGIALETYPPTDGDKDEYIHTIIVHRPGVRVVVDPNGRLMRPSRED